MKTHKVKNIIKKQRGYVRVVFTDGNSISGPCEQMSGIHPSMRVQEHVDKNGMTVAYSWDGNIRFVTGQPFYFDDAVKFIKNFRLFDRVRFNNAVIKTMHYRNRNPVFPDTEKFAHNLVLFGIKTKMHQR